MKLKIQYINKKMLAGIMLGAVAFSIAGCGCEAKSNYVEISEGVYELSNSIYFDDLKTYQLVEMKVDGKVDLYITEKNTKTLAVYYAKKSAQLVTYHNVLNNEIIYTVYDDSKKENNVENKNTLLKEENMFDYLIAYNEIQDSYTKEDIERILGKIKEDWNFADQKENSKEKLKIKE